jgi:hypothetical protein
MRTSKRANICFCHTGHFVRNFWKLNKRIQASGSQHHLLKIDAACVDSGGKAGWVPNRIIDGIRPSGKWVSDRWEIHFGAW